MQPSTLLTLTVVLFATVVLCNAEYRYKFRPPRPPAPANYKKWNQMAQHRSYRKPSIYRFAPPPPLPPKRPPSFSRRPYKSPQLLFPNPLWQPKAIFPNPYQQIPISFKEQQTFKGQQYFKDPLLKEPLILKNPQLFEEQFAKPQSSLSSFPHAQTLNAHLHLLQVPQQVHHQVAPQVHHQLLPQVQHQVPHTNAVILKSPLHLDAEREGPIRTIPAPNLSGSHILRPTGMVLQPIGNVYQQYQQYAQPAQTSVAQPRPLVIPQYHVTEEQSNDVRVRNPLTGAQKLYAPDPDPRLPAPPVHPATDPFSMPSNGKPLPPDIPRYTSQQQSSGSKGLTTQEFYDLLNSFPLPHAQDSVYQSSNQPQLHQHLMQQAHGLPIPTIDSALAFLQQPASSASYQSSPYSTGTNYIAQQSNFQPQYQTFNYQEQDQSSATGQFYSKDQENDFEYQSQASQKIPSVLPLAEPERINDLSNSDILVDNENQQAIEQLINPEPAEPSTSSNANVKMDSAFSRNYYTTLPNRQAAETLATLQAAGSINNNLMNILRKKQQEARLNGEKKVASNAQNDEPSPAPTDDSTMRIFVPDYNDSYEDGEVITASNHNERSDEFRDSQEQISSEENNPSTKAVPLDSATSKNQESTKTYGTNNRKS